MGTRRGWEWRATWPRVGTEVHRLITTRRWHSQRMSSLNSRSENEASGAVAQYYSGRFQPAQDHGGNSQKNDPSKWSRPDSDVQRSAHPFT